jgi:GNAT superfamily N-acetyltransferase
MSAAATTSRGTLGTRIVHVDHPSFGNDIDRFLCELRNEPRFFGPTASTNPKPFPSLIEALRGRGGFRVAAVESGRIVGLARIDGSGELFIAVVGDRRRSGIGQRLAAAAFERAAELHYATVSIRSTRRSEAMHRLCQRFGSAAIDLGRGHVELIVTPTPLRRSA